MTEQTQTRSMISADLGLFALVSRRFDIIWFLGAIQAKCTVISLAVVAAGIDVSFGIVSVAAPNLVLSVLENVL
jgi:hypothetical protein